MDTMRFVVAESTNSQALDAGSDSSEADAAFPSPVSRFSKKVVAVVLVVLLAPVSIHLAKPTLLQRGNAEYIQIKADTNSVTPAIYTCGGSHLGDDRGEGSPCIFPFTYKDVTYTGCTDKDDGKKWCATSYSSGSTNHRSWGYCNCATATYTCGGVHSGDDSGLGSPCTFPFKYKGVVYEACTSFGHDQPWCATSLHPDTNHARSWGNCNCPPR